MTTALLSRPARQRGVSLIEAATVLAVIAVVAGTAAPSLQAVIDARRLDAAAAQLATDIRFTRTEAVARNEALRLSVRPVAGGTCYLVHTGAVDACTCPSTGPAVCSGDARALRTVVLPGGERVSLQANVGSILFDPVHGTSTPTGTLRLIGTRERAIHHIVNVMGRVRSCSPAGAVPGYRAC
ncbi:MAG: GspH/FimT family pseudopilin [Pseudomonadota bacterium]